MKSESHYSILEFSIVLTRLIEVANKFNVRLSDSIKYELSDADVKHHNLPDISEHKIYESTLILKDQTIMLSTDYESSRFQDFQKVDLPEDFDTQSKKSCIYKVYLKAYDYLYKVLHEKAKDVMLEKMTNKTYDEMCLSVLGHVPCIEHD